MGLAKNFVNFMQRQKKSAEEKERYLHLKLDQKLKKRNLWMLFAALLSVISTTVTLSVDWDAPNEVIIPYSALRTEPQFKSRFYAHEFFRALGVLASLTNIVQLINYYTLMSEFKRTQWNFTSRASAFFNSSLKWKFLLELIVLIVQPVPFYENSVGFGDFLGLFEFGRLYLAVRAVRDFSPVWAQRHEIVLSNDKYRFNKPEFGWILAVRMLFYQHTMTILFTLAISSTLIFGFCVWIVERQYNPLLNTFSNSMWLMLVASTTVGFGDVYPITKWGRTITILQTFIGIGLAGVLTGVFASKLQPSKDQAYAVSFLLRRKMTKAIRYSSIMLIQAWWRKQKGKITKEDWIDISRAKIKTIQGARRKLFGLTDLDEGNPDAVDSGSASGNSQPSVPITPRSRTISTFAPIAPKQEAAVAASLQRMETMMNHLMQKNERLEAQNNFLSQQLQALLTAMQKSNPIQN